MIYYHHEDHGGAGLSEEEKAVRLAAHMLDHNVSHRDEILALAERFAALGREEEAERIREASARMDEANAALRAVLAQKEAR